MPQVAKNLSEAPLSEKCVLCQCARILAPRGARTCHVDGASASRAAQATVQLPQRPVDKPWSASSDCALAQGESRAGLSGREAAPLRRAMSIFTEAPLCAATEL